MEGRATEPWKIQRRKELEALQLGIKEAGGLKLICCYDQQSKVWRGTSFGAHERIRYYFLICNSNILKEKISMIESVAFHRLITDFEENGVRVDDPEGRRRARLYQDEAWCSSSGTLSVEKLSLEEKMLSCYGIWT